MSKQSVSFHFWVAVFCLPAVAALGQDQPPRPAFEVASVRPSATSDSDSKKMIREAMLQGMMNDRNPGFISRNRAHITLQGRSLASLIATAYQVRSNQVIGPAWISEGLFDIEAKMPDDAPPESVNEMLQTLLEERFALKVHREPRTLPGFALLVAKGGPKLELADADTPTPNLDAIKAQTEKRMEKMAMEVQMKTDVTGSKDSTDFRRFAFDRITHHVVLGKQS